MGWLSAMGDRGHPAKDYYKSRIKNANALIIFATSMVTSYLEFLNVNILLSIKTLSRLRMLVTFELYVAGQRRH